MSVVSPLIASSAHKHDIRDDDMLNAFNHTNYGNPVTNITASNFGRITGTRGARVVQLYLRFTF